MHERVVCVWISRQQCNNAIITKKPSAGARENVNSSGSRRTSKHRQCGEKRPKSKCREKDGNTTLRSVIMTSCGSPAMVSSWRIHGVTSLRSSWRRSQGHGGVVHVATERVSQTCPSPKRKDVTICAFQCILDLCRV